MVARATLLLGLIAVGAVGLAVAAALRSLASAPVADGAVVLDVQPVALDPADPTRATVGALHYRGGLWLRSGDARFGGLSDLRVSPDGERLLAVTDCGQGFTASLLYGPDGSLAGLEDARLVALTGPTGSPLALGEADAESLVWGEHLEVGFEGRRARVQGYAGQPPFGGPAQPLPFPPDLRGCGPNGGLETMVDAGEGRRLLVCEARRGTSSTVPAWIGRGAAWTPREYPLLFEGGWAGEPFRPSGGARLPDGDLLLVERRFPPLGARLVRLPRASLEGGGPLAPVEIARLEAPLIIDNFEGVEARRDASGRTLVYLLSDDNNCAKAPGSLRSGLQRTLLLLFRLEG